MLRPTTRSASQVVVTCAEPSGSRARICAALSRIEAALKPHDIQVVHRLLLDLRPDEKGVAREHFRVGRRHLATVPFDDGGRAQHRRTACAITGTASRSAKSCPATPTVTTKRHSGLVVPDDAKGQAAGLVAYLLAEGFLDFGIHGSYMVARELKQDVVAFAF